MTAPQTAATPVVEPTDVIGRRIAARLVDTLLLAVFAFVLLGALADWTTLSVSTTDTDLEITDGRAILFRQGTIYVIEIGDLVTWGLLVVAAWAVIHVALEGWQGLSPGKALFGLRVIHPSGRVPGPRAALVRNVVAVADAMPGLPVVGVAAAARSPRRQRLGDRVAGTVVVRHRKHPA